MEISKRLQSLSESLTLALNAKANRLAGEGKEVFNLTAGQLPNRPPQKFINEIKNSLSELSHYQYTPVSGTTVLKEKVISYISKSRSIDIKKTHSCLVTNGGKHALSNLFLGLIDEGDEVIVLSPYWVSYPEMIRLCGGVPIIVEGQFSESFVPPIDKIKNKINSNTKAIIINSPNNPSGVSYPSSWMKEVASLLNNNPSIAIINDEIYFELSYKNQKVDYFYNYEPSLLDQTIIVSGISKNLASTGLRIGFMLAPNELAKNLNKLQGQTSSGANSLMQAALKQFDFDEIDLFLEDIKVHLEKNADLLRKSLNERQLDHLWYEANGAFYFLIDFSTSSRVGSTKDESLKVCDELLEKVGVAMVPGIAFGISNCARISLVMDSKRFQVAISKTLDYLFPVAKA